MNTPRLLFTLFILSVKSFSAFAQSTTITPGSVLPQMTSAQRTALANPVNGMLVFDTNTNSYWFRQNTAWVELPKGGSTANYWQLDGLGGNEIKNTNSGGFWSENPVGLYGYSNNTSNPPNSPVNGNGTRLMWIPSRSAFRVGTVSDGAKSWDADSIGLFSIATGFNSKAIGKYSTAMGYNTKASGIFSIAMGERTKATGLTSTSLGYSTEASGRTSTSLGYNTKASGYISTAMGSYSWASGDHSTAMGYGAKAKAMSSLSIGTYNDDSDSPNSGIEASTDRLFQIGNGSSDLNRSNAMTVLRNGYVGLMNENSPVAPLHIGNGPNNWERHIRLDYDPVTDEHGNIVYDHQGMKFKAWGTGDNFYFRNNVNTSVAIMYESGNMTIAGTLTQNSDARLKKDLQKISNSSSKLAGLNAYHYHWKAIDRDQKLQTGLLAQEVQEVFPELVNEDEDGYLSVNYVGLIPHLIESHKELKAENEELRKDMKELKSENIELERRLSLIEQKLLSEPGSLSASSK